MQNFQDRRWIEFTCCSTKRSWSGIICTRCVLSRFVIKRNRLCALLTDEASDRESMELKWPSGEYGNVMENSLKWHFHVSCSRIHICIRKPQMRFHPSLRYRTLDTHQAPRQHDPRDLLRTIALASLIRNSLKIAVIEETNSRARFAN